MDTFDVLDPKTNVFGLHFLEASAGTGKTFAIENIVPRLLLEAKDPLCLQEILVVTFTRAATRELKSRIYHNLHTILAALKGGTPVPSYVEGVEDKEKLKLIIEEALCSFESVPIFTLHGFCLRLLQEFAFDTGAFFSAAEEEEMRKEPAMAECIKDFFRSKRDQEYLSPAQVSFLCKYKKIGKDIEALSSFVLRILEKKRAIKEYADAKTLWTLWNKEIAALPRVSADVLVEEFSIAAPRLAKVPRRKKQATALFSQIERGYSSYEEWDAILEDEDFLLEKIKEPSEKNLAKLSHWEVFDKLKKHLIPLRKEATDPKILLLRLAAACRNYYERGKKEVAHFSPDDFVLMVRESLQQPDFVAKVRAKYKVLIIDEFQDTDKDQWGMFETIFLQEGLRPLALYLVGDPKQSIYGFRSADVYMYLRAREFFSDLERFYLGTNFRSHPDLVQALNLLFSFRLPSSWMLLPHTKEYLEVRSVESKPLYESVLTEDSLGRVHFFIQEGEEEESLLSYVAGEILRLKQEKGISFQEIAILVKDRYQAILVKEVCSSYGIPCLMQQRFSLRDPAFRAMKEFLQVLVSPSDLSVIKVFLGGELIGLSAHDVVGSWDNPLFQKVQNLGIRGQESLKKKGFGPFFFDFLHTSYLEGKGSVGEELLKRKGSQLYFSLRQLCQLLLEHAGDALYDPKELADFLEQMEFRSQEDPLFQGSIETEEDQIQVMTLHKSKGLEFPVVFALGVSFRHRREEEYFLAQGEIVANTEKEEHVQLHREELDAEKLRQLYVALTRAKERVYIPLIFPKKQGEIVVGTASPIELFLYGFGLESYTFAKVYEQIACTTKETIFSHLIELGKRGLISHEVITTRAIDSFVAPAIVLSAPPSSVFSFSQGRYCSFSSLASDSHTTTVLQEKIEDPIPAGAETGVIVHSILEELCKTGLHQELGPKALACIEKYCVGTFLEDKMQIVQERLMASLQEPILIDGEPLFRMCDIPSDDMQLEVEFLYPLGSSLIKGFIDVIFRWRDLYFLLDWKTNLLPEYTKQTLEGCMKENQYDLQASIYTQALQKQLAIYEHRPFSSCFGGVIYVFLRGKKNLHFFPDVSLLAEKGKL